MLRLAGARAEVVSDRSPIGATSSPRAPCSCSEAMKMETVGASAVRRSGARSRACRPTAKVENGAPLLRVEPVADDAEAEAERRRARPD